MVSWEITFWKVLTKFQRNVHHGVEFCKARACKRTTLQKFNSIVDVFLGVFWKFRVAYLESSRTSAIFPKKPMGEARLGSENRFSVKLLYALTLKRYTREYSLWSQEVYWSADNLYSIPCVNSIYVL